MTTSRLLAALLLVLGLVFAPGYVDNVDSRIVLRTSERLLDDGAWALPGADPGRPGEYGVMRPDGFQMKFGAGNALLAVPFVALGRGVLGALGLAKDRAGEAGASLAAALWFAAAGVLVFRIARRLLGERGAVGTALLWSVATYALVYGKSSYLEMPLTVAVLGAFDAALVLREDPRRRGAAVALGVACVAVLWIKLAACVLLAGLLPILWTAGPRRIAHGLALAGGVLAAGVLLLSWLNDARFGSPFATGYAGSARFDHPFWTGVAELLASSRGGLFVYSPVLVLALPGTALLARRDGALALGIWIAFAAAICLYAPFFSPFGGDAWGPRYLLPNAALLAVPAGVALHDWLAAGPVRRGVAAAAFAGSIALQAPPALVSFHEMYGLRDDVGVARTADVGPQRLTARIAAEKARGPDDAYDLARLGLGAGTHVPGRVERGWNLWPRRVADDLPRRSTFAWAAWWTLVAVAAATSVALVRRTRGAS